MENDVAGVVVVIECGACRGSGRVSHYNLSGIGVGKIDCRGCDGSGKATKTVTLDEFVELLDRQRVVPKEKVDK